MDSNRLIKLNVKVISELRQDVSGKTLELDISPGENNLGKFGYPLSRYGVLKARREGDGCVYMEFDGEKFFVTPGSTYTQKREFTIWSQGRQPEVERIELIWSCRK